MTKAQYDLIVAQVQLTQTNPIYRFNLTDGKWLQGQERKVIVSSLQIPVS